MREVLNRLLFFLFVRRRRDSVNKILVAILTGVTIILKAIIDEN